MFSAQTEENLGAGFAKTESLEFVEPLVIEKMSIGEYAKIFSNEIALIVIYFILIKNYQDLM